MATVISLREVLDAMHISSDDSMSYLDLDSGEIITVTEEDRHLVQEESPDELPAWQLERQPKIRAVLESDHFLPFPDRFEIHEWSIMEEFSGTQENARIRRELLDAIGTGLRRPCRWSYRPQPWQQSFLPFIAARQLRPFQTCGRQVLSRWRGGRYRVGEPRDLRNS